MVIPPLCIFPNPPLLTAAFRQHRPNEIRDNKNKPMKETCFFMFKILQNNIS